MTRDRAPIALFVYNRPEHTSRTLTSLLAGKGARDRRLFVFADGPKSPADAADVSRTRQVVDRLAGRSATVIAAEVNQGLAASIISGVNRIVETHGRVIVLEDDLLVDARFLPYMDNALGRYENDDQVMQISGYMFPVKALESHKEAIFMPLTTSWGWGTWQRAWRRFDPEAVGWRALTTDHAMRRAFNFDGIFDFAAMLEKQMRGSIDSWAIRWYWTVFRSNGLVLYPPISLINNIGFDGSGTHGWRTARRMSASPLKSGVSIALPEITEVNDAIVAEVRRSLRSSRGGMLTRTARCLLRLLRRSAAMR